MANHNYEQVVTLHCCFHGVFFLSVECRDQRLFRRTVEWGGYMKIKPVNWLIPGREQDQMGVAFALGNYKETPAYP
jgi:hypothetical protein